jgi:hypothetical protein
MIIKNYKDLIQERHSEVLFFVSGGLHSILERIADDPIANHILSDMNKMVMKPMSYFDRTSEIDMVTYTPADRVMDEIREKGLEPSDPKIFNIKSGWLDGRQQIKIGRFIGRVADKQFTPKQIEEFVNRYKAETKKEVSGIRWERVHGFDINKWYMNTTYVKGGGTLNRSCLRKKNRNMFINFLSGNPNKVRMAILLNDQNQLLGRCLLWKLDDPKGRMFADRVYTRFDEDINTFVELFRKNGILYKSKQTYGGEIPIIDGRTGEEKWIRMTVNDFKKVNFQGYPYADTLQYYDQKNNILTNDVRIFNNDNVVKLNKVDGTFTTYDEGDVDTGDFL